MSADGDDTALERLRAAALKLVEPVDPYDPPVEHSEFVRDWAMNTSILTIGVAALVAGLEYYRRRDDPLHVPKQLPPGLHDLYLRNLQSARFAKVAQRGLYGGIFALGFGSCLSSAEAISAISRNRRDWANTAVGGLVTCFIFGGMVPGSLSFRLSRAAYGGLVGTVVGSLVGFLSHELVPRLQAADGQERAPPT